MDVLEIQEFTVISLVFREYLGFGYRGRKDTAEAAEIFEGTAECGRVDPDDYIAPLRKFYL